MNVSRIAALMKELAELDAQRSEVERRLALAFLEPEPLEEQTPSLRPRGSTPRPEPEVTPDDLARTKARRLLRRAGVAPR